MLKCICKECKREIPPEFFEVDQDDEGGMCFRCISDALDCSTVFEG